MSPSQLVPSTDKPSKSNESVVVKRWLAVLGALLLLSGSTAVFVSTNSGGTAALIGAGTVVITLAAFADRLKTFEGGGIKFELGPQVAARLEAAEIAELEGDAESARRLREEASLLVAAVQPIATSYEATRAARAPSWERTRDLEHIVAQGRSMAALPFATREAAEQLFASGNDGNRIVALGMMAENRRIASMSAVCEAIEHSRSAFEQFQALRATRAALGGKDVDNETKQRIRESIEKAAFEGHLKTAGPGRTGLLNEIRRLY